MPGRGRLLESEELNALEAQRSSDSFSEAAIHSATGPDSFAAAAGALYDAARAFGPEQKIIVRAGAHRVPVPGRVITARCVDRRAVLTGPGCGVRRRRGQRGGRR